MNELAQIGIVSVGTYTPSVIETSADIAEKTGIEEWVIRDKFGIHQKHIPGPNDHTNYMGIQAAKNCLAKTDIKPEEIDLILCTTEEWKEYLLWTAGIDMAQQIGATKAWAIDVQMRCGTTIGAIYMAQKMMQADPDLNTVLIAGGYRNGDFIDYSNKRVSFMYNLGAGGGALLLKKGHNENIIRGSHLMTDGSMSKDVIVPASGTVQPPSDATKAEGLFQLDLVEPEHMKDRLNAVSMDNWMHCIDEALRKSGKTREDVDFLNVLHMKPSGHRDMCNRLGITEEQSVYLNEFGHIGQQDAMFSIEEGLKQGKLKDGDTMIIVAAGIGYAWGASVVEWGKPQK